MIIYTITHIPSGKIYVGQTRRPSRRWYEHLNNLNKYVSLVDRAIQKYGKDMFVYAEVDTASSIEELNLKEEQWILALNTLHPNGYNLVLKGSTTITSEHTKMKQSAAQKKRASEYVVTQATKDKISKIHKGRKKSQEQIMKMKANHRSKKRILLDLIEDDSLLGVRHRVEPDRYIDQYIASIVINGKYKSKCFSVKKYGEDEAKRLAIEARRGFEQEAKRVYEN